MLLPSGDVLPSSHGVHVVAPVEAEKLPVQQSLHAESPGSLLKLPVSHGLQPSISSNPAMHMQVALPSSDVVLASQAAHDDEPAGEYSFFPQVKHEAAGDTVVPGTQKVHSDSDLAPIMGRYLPPGHDLQGSEMLMTGHAEQFEAPTIDVNLPISQTEHVATEVAPSACEYLPVSHSMHVLSTYAPTTPECLPAAHLRQDVSESAPSSGEYLPLTQSWQLVDASLSA